MSHYVGSYFGQGASINLAGFGATREPETRIDAVINNVSKVTSIPPPRTGSGAVMTAQMLDHVRKGVAQGLSVDVAILNVLKQHWGVGGGSSWTPKEMFKEFVRLAKEKSLGDGINWAKVVDQLKAAKLWPGLTENTRAVQEAVDDAVLNITSSSAPASSPSSKAPFVIVGLIGLGGLVLFMIKKKKKA